MIRREELRVGNIVMKYNKYDLEDQEGIVGPGDFFCPSQLTGIPLTEEWVLKFDFQKFDNSYTKVYQNNCDFIIFNSNTPVAKTNNILDWYYFFHKTVHIIKWVHQLQNLFFALTGEELKEK